MKIWIRLLFAGAALVLAGPVAFADMQGTGQSAGWEKRVAVKPDASKVVVPSGYQISIFAQGLDTPSSATKPKFSEATPRCCKKGV